ncbi:MAG: hypothetical protein M5U34_43275 [Chloroflexi bacterium]|nr:hypothetical protein [Chloroflexota bacterium]
MANRKLYQPAAAITGIRGWRWRRRRQILRAIWRTGARFYAGGHMGEIEALKTAVTPDTAAVILETIPATLGMPHPAA